MTTGKIVTVTDKPPSAAEQVQASAKDALSGTQNFVETTSSPVAMASGEMSKYSRDPETAIFDNWFDEFWALDKIIGERADWIVEERKRARAAVEVLKKRKGLA